MKIRLLFCLLLSFGLSGPVAADLFLVTTSDGPGFAGPGEAAQVLENGIIPMFDMLLDMQAKKKIVAGGLPAGSRSFYLIVEADSNAEVDQMLRDLPAWGVFAWKVKPLQSLQGRADMEKQILKDIKSQQ